MNGISMSGISGVGSVLVVGLWVHRRNTEPTGGVGLDLTRSIYGDHDFLTLFTNKIQFLVIEISMLDPDAS